MAQRLEEIAAATRAIDDPFDSPRVVDELRSVVSSEKDPGARLLDRLDLAEHLTRASRPEEAIAEIESLQALPEAERKPAGPEFDYRLLDARALASLRLGELENCLALHGVDSCLMPIRGTGIHQIQRGSRGAIAQYEAMLALKPDDLSARWLLNVAYMTLGGYPGDVPPKWLIPPKAFESERDVGRFWDVASAAGVGPRGLSGGAIMDDFDGDGLLDVMTSSWGLRDQLQLFVSRGDGTFVERTEEAGLVGLVGGLNLVQADYDNDGDIDVFVPRGAWRRKAGRIPNSLLRNDGDGTFTDVTEAAGLLTFHPTQVAAWGDYDGDGVLDLFVGNESMPDDPQPSELWHGEGDGTFRDASASLGDTTFGYVKGAAWGDIDNDGLPELYVSVLGKPNLLFHDEGRAGAAPGTWSFVERGAAAHVAEPLYTFPTWFFDYDNDGWLDIFAGGFLQGRPGDTAALYLDLPNEAALPRLFHNLHDGTFADVTHEARLDRVTSIMGSNYGDIDNDGWPDLYLGTGDPDLRTIVPNRMFRNDSGRRFQDVTSSGGFGHLQKGHGVAFGDVDGDGDQDVYEDMGGAVAGDIAQNTLFENPGHGNHWITLRLQGTASNRAAIGARVKVSVATPRGPRNIHVLAGSGGSFGGNSLQQEIGLGDATGIRTVEVRWPAAASMLQTYAGASLDRAYTVIEGEKELVPVPLRHFELARPAGVPKR